MKKPEKNKKPEQVMGVEVPLSQLFGFENIKEDLAKENKIRKSYGLKPRKIKGL